MLSKGIVVRKTFILNVALSFSFSCVVNVRMSSWLLSTTTQIAWLASRRSAAYWDAGNTPGNHGDARDS